MKKIIVIVIVFLLVVNISSCQKKKTYDMLQREYLEHISTNVDRYQVHIDFFNNVSVRAIKGVVLVTKTIHDDIGSAKGTGVIFHSDEQYYYVLTNNHLVYMTNEQLVSYQVNDFNGNVYNATFVSSDKNYDLAILKFEKGKLDLRVVNLAPRNPEVGSNLAILGNPLERINVITLGTVINYSPVAVEFPSQEVINIDFDILIANAPVKSGSSGSVVITEKLELIGIVYAGNFIEGSNTSNFTFIIPVEKVREFLAENDFIMDGIK